MKNKTNTRKLVLMALTASIAMVLSAIEAQMPAFTTVPGVKVGLANIAHARGRYLFMVNSAEKPVAGIVSGMPENTVVKDAVTGEKIAVAGKDGIKLEFKSMEVKLLKLERN